jgi:hypothetical protein
MKPLYKRNYMILTEEESKKYDGIKKIFWQRHYYSCGNGRVIHTNSTSGLP